MDRTTYYEQMIKKVANARVTNPKRQYSETEHFDVNNPKFDKDIEKLLNIQNAVNIVTKDNYDLKGMMLLDRMRLRTLANHFKETTDIEPSFSEKLINSLSFKSWCGRGTDIMKNIELDQDFKFHYPIDMICKRHDLATFRAKDKFDIVSADVFMLAEIIDLYAIPNLFGTQEKIYGLENFYKNILSMKTVGNMLKISSAINTIKTPIDFLKAQYKYSTYESHGNVNTFEDMFEIIQPRLGEFKSVYSEYKEQNIKEYLQAQSRLKWGVFTGATSFTFQDTILSLLTFTAITFKIVYENLFILPRNLILGSIQSIDEILLGADPDERIYIKGFTDAEQDIYKPEVMEDLIQEFKNFQNEKLVRHGLQPLDNLLNIDFENLQFEPIEFQSPAIPIPPEKTESESDTETQQDIKQDIFDFTDIAFGTTQEKIQNLLSYIENIEE